MKHEAETAIVGREFGDAPIIGLDSNVDTLKGITVLGKIRKVRV